MKPSPQFEQFPDISSLSPAEAIAWYTEQVRIVMEIRPGSRGKTARMVELATWKETVLNPWLREVRQNVHN